jgi:hypothetical protein
MSPKIKRLWFAHTRRQLVMLAVFAGIAGLNYAATGAWVGWPAIVIGAVFINALWSIVA